MNFKNNKTLYINDGSPLQRYENLIPSSNQIAGIEIRMLPPFIKNNRTAAFWPFPGYANLYCLTIVISDKSNQLTGCMDLNTFSRVNDNEYLPINKTIYYWEPSKIDDSPSQVHIMSAIIKSKESLRDTASIIADIKSDTNYKDVSDYLTSIVSGTASFSVIANLSLQIAKIVAHYLGKVHDKPLGTIINSFTRLHGDWDKLGITPLNIVTKDVNFHFELIVRDKSRKAIIDDNKNLLDSDKMIPL